VPLTFAIHIPGTETDHEHLGTEIPQFTTLVFLASHGLFNNCTRAKEQKQTAKFSSISLKSISSQWFLDLVDWHILAFIMQALFFFIIYFTHLFDAVLETVHDEYI